MVVFAHTEKLDHPRARRVRVHRPSLHTEPRVAQPTVHGGRRTKRVHLFPGHIYDSRYSVRRIKLSGWSDSINDNLEDYDDVTPALDAKYLDKLDVPL